MTYSDATDSYQNDYLEGIPGTEYRFDLPYRIDRKIYEKVLRDHNQGIRLKDADVVRFRADYYDVGDEGDEQYNYVFYAWGENSPEGSNDFYECVQFHWEDYPNPKEAFEEFVREIMECVIAPDEEYVNREIDELTAEMEKTKENIEILKKSVEG